MTTGCCAGAFGSSKPERAVVVAPEAAGRSVVVAAGFAIVDFVVAADSVEKSFHAAFAKLLVFEPLPNHDCASYFHHRSKPAATGIMETSLLT